MNTNSQTAIKKSKMKITTPKVIRWAGLSAMAAGIIFVGIQPIHPPDVLASVNTSLWAIITSLKLAMCFFFLLGITGLYARQVEESGRLGLVGFLLLVSLGRFRRASSSPRLYILPVLATAAPKFVDTYLGIVNGSPAEMNIGALVPTYAVVGILYMLGGLIFGIATFRARVLPRWPAGLLAVVAVLTPAAALLPHAIQRVAAGMPMGIAVAWLGYALWSERRAPASKPAPCEESPLLSQPVAA